MSQPWAISVRKEDAVGLASLRLEPGIEVTESEDHIWVRGKTSSPGIDAKLRGVPAAGRFEWMSSDQLRPLSSRIPSARFPSTPWKALKEWLQIEWPVAALPAHEPRQLPFTLVRGGAEEGTTLLQTTWSKFMEWAGNAPSIRLDRLRLAVQSAEKILIWGSPLPPLPGLYWVVRGQLAIPAGWHFEPELEIAAVEHWLKAGKETLVLFHSDATFVRIHCEQFVPATPSALKRTHQILHPLTPAPVTLGVSA
jgi:hypothetical protein